jgi:hypothetical protein
MVILLLSAILVVLIVGFWGEAGAAFLLLVGLGALALFAAGVILVIILVLLSGSAGSVAGLWKSYVVPFWNAHGSTFAPPIVSVAVVAIWMHVTKKYWVFLRKKSISDLLPSSNEPALERIVFWLVGAPALLFFFILILAAFIAPIIFVAQLMHLWWISIFPK